jgi:hypothetical protein
VYDARDMDHVRPDVRPRITVFDAWRQGWRRVFRAPVLIVGIAAALACALGLNWRGQIVDRVSWVLGNDALGFGGPLGLVQAIGSAQVLRRVALGMLPTLAAVDPGVAVLLFLAGGAIDRLARERRVGTAAFFAACGTGFMQFLRMGVVLGGANWLLLHLAVPAALRALPEIDQSTGWWQPRAVVAAIGLTATWVLAVVGDYAKVRAIVEDRRSALGAIAAAVRFVWRRPVRIIALYALNLAVVTIGVTLSVDAFSRLPGGQNAALAATAIAIMLALQVLARLGFMATSIAFFQGELAHAGYTAAPVPAWPDSPSVEAIANLADRHSAADRALPL